jgi:D-beta-D-heptose 7-phosphate kinase/D-beta-D-heptose 1-phosphate adenosyltransferase
VCASGYFSVIHRGHIEYLEKSKALGDILIVIVNNDQQTMLKHGVVFKSIEDRLEVIRSLRCVDIAIVSIDTDRSVCKTLECLRPHIFSNGGDALNDNIPEKIICDKYNIKMIDGLGEKIQSSRWLLSDYCNKKLQ